MRKSRITETQIDGVLHEHEAPAKIAGPSRPHTVIETTFRRWKRKYGGLQINEVKGPASPFWTQLSVEPN